MRVAAFTGFDGSNDVAVQKTDDPEPGPIEVVLDVAACSINRHDLWILEGDSAMVGTNDLPFVIGFDVAGEVTERGSAIDSVFTGDRVVLCPNQTCGVCRYCREGPENCCEQFGLYHGGRRDETYIAPRVTFKSSFPERVHKWMREHWSEFGFEKPLRGKK